jgi:hypothetical protein
MSIRSLNSKFKPKALYASMLNSPNHKSVGMLPIFTEDFFLSPTSLNLLNFSTFNNESLGELTEDSYSNIKNSSVLYNQGHQFSNLTSLNFFNPVSYTTVLNSFRADFDENL